MKSVAPRGNGYVDDELEEVNRKNKALNIVFIVVGVLAAGFVIFIIVSIVST